MLACVALNSASRVQLIRIFCDFLVMQLEFHNDIVQCD